MKSALFIGAAAALLAGAVAASGQSAPRASQREQLVTQADRTQEGVDATQGQAQRDQQAQPSQTKEPQRQPPQSDTTPLSADEDLVRRVQSVLRDKGLLDDDPDGIFGARTRAALIQYQRRFGLEPTGEINVQTVHFIDQLGLQRARTIQDGRKARGGGQATEPNRTPPPTQGLRGPGTPTSTDATQNPTAGQNDTGGQATPPAPSPAGRASIGGGRPARPAIPSIGAPGSLSGTTGGVGSGISGAIGGTGGPAGTTGTTGGGSSR